MKYFSLLQKIFLLSVIILVLIIALFCTQKNAKAQSQTGNGITLVTTVDKTKANSGSVLTFTINYTIGANDVKNVKIEDSIPEGVFYINGSATLNGNVLTDSDDLDNYNFIQNKATWILENQTANGKGKVSFQAKVPVNLFTYGVAGQGGDDTFVIQSALNDAVSKGLVLYIPPSASPYMVKPITIPANSNLLLGSGTVIQAANDYGKADRVISIRDTQNVTIMGYGAKIQMPKAEYLVGTGRHGVGIYGSNNINIYGLASNSAGGDGFYIGETSKQNYSGNINLIDCLADNNLRQGLSVISVKNLLVKRCHFTNTNGAAPQSGIDMEPNYAHDQLTNINIEDSFTSNNLGLGVIVSTHALDETSIPVSIKVIRHTDTYSGLTSYEGYSGNGVGGTIEFNDCKSFNAGYHGAFASVWRVTGPMLIFNNLIIDNPNQTSKTIDHAAVYVANSTSTGAAALGNVTFINTKITGSPDKLWNYFSIRDLSNSGISNLKYVPGTSSGAKNHPYGLLNGVNVTSVDL
ncbi:MAG: Parallel beta-helix repeat-containing protein [Berkelbacteria bacterium GW2011_GWE1_39_12]|uniref:Parallel beta-helix repeat-containing protein n=1 Tax=Berkelbacteria bacterium GW2011_GWE1_39_12 TaxID=1618337 RepID=A0A0G4B1Z0_9BACT|nr:MAG: Parallel beta-helix repeat-containing protein [Berkelbacteria bacterium GW2011_GWE1_39_12]